MKTISIDDDVYALIASRTADIGESASQVLRRELNMGSLQKVAEYDTRIEELVAEPRGARAWRRPADSLGGEGGVPRPDSQLREEKK